MSADTFSPPAKAGATLLTGDEAMLQGRIAAMARNYATCTGRYGDCSPTDLRIIGFDLDEIRDHWITIVDRGLLVLEEMRIKGCAA